MTYGFWMRRVQHVSEGAVGGSEERPHGAGSFLDVSVLSLLPAVTQERPEQTRVCVLHKLHLNTQNQKNSELVQQIVKSKYKEQKVSPTRKASLNSKEHGNCLWSWCTQSNHCRKTGHLSFKSSAFSPWPQRSANLWPKSNHSVSTSTWKP